MVAWRPIDQSSRDPCAESSPVRIDQQPQPHREPRGRSISSPSKSVVNSGDLPCTAKRYDHRAQAFVAAKATIERQAKGEVKHPKVSGLARERASERASRCRRQHPAAAPRESHPRSKYPFTDCRVNTLLRLLHSTRHPGCQPSPLAKQHTWKGASSHKTAV